MVYVRRIGRGRFYVDLDIEIVVALISLKVKLHTEYRMGADILAFGVPGNDAALKIIETTLNEAGQERRTSLTRCRKA